MNIDRITTSFDQERNGIRVTIFPSLGSGFVSPPLDFGPFCSEEEYDACEVEIEGSKRKLKEIVDLHADEDVQDSIAWFWFDKEEKNRPT